MGVPLDAAKRVEQVMDRLWTVVWEGRQEKGFGKGWA
jgi:hypothetical protein